MAKQVLATASNRPRVYMGRPVDPETIKAGLQSAQMTDVGVMLGKPRKRVMAGIGKTINEDWLSRLWSKGKAALKTTGGKAAGVVGVAALIDLLVQGGFGIAGEVQQGLQEGQALDAQANAMNPEAMKERALQPITKAQRDQAMMLLMRQLGVKQSNVADGEAWT